MLNRRSFIIASGLTALASTRVLGANDTVRIGVIGAGGRMRNLLDAADKLGPYQIVEPIGAGGIVRVLFSSQKPNSPGLRPHSCNAMFISPASAVLGLQTS